jgi:hypothetical protein
MEYCRPIGTVHRGIQIPFDTWVGRSSVGHSAYRKLQGDGDIDRWWGWPGPAGANPGSSGKLANDGSLPWASKDWIGLVYKTGNTFIEGSLNIGSGRGLFLGWAIVALIAETGAAIENTYRKFGIKWKVGKKSLVFINLDANIPPVDILIGLVSKCQEFSDEGYWTI